MGMLPVPFSVYGKRYRDKTLEEVFLPGP